MIDLPAQQYVRMWAVRLKYDIITQKIPIIMCAGMVTGQRTTDMCSASVASWTRLEFAEGGGWRARAQCLRY
jgi:hypothetical protein